QVHLHRLGQRLAPLAVGLGGLGDHHQLLGVGAGDREGDHVALADAGDLLDLPLDALRVVVAPVDDDEVLRAARDVELAAASVAEVAGAQPAVVAEGVHRGLGVAEVAAGDAGPAEPDLAGLALGQARAGLGEDADVVAGERPAARHVLVPGVIRIDAQPLV